MKMKSEVVVEACTENFSESLIAQKNGATRIELCDNLTVGGTTPSYGTIKLCIDKLSIPSFVMIRPRGGNFIYNEQEINIMLHDINVCQSLGAKGVVFGCLKENGSFDYELMDILVKTSAGMEVVLHKAFDEVTDSYLEIEKLQRIGIKHILSSGGMDTALEGKDNLLKIYKECQKYGVKLTVAGKITSENLENIMDQIPADAYHGKLIVPLA